MQTWVVSVERYVMCVLVSFVDVACCSYDTDFVGMHGKLSCIDGAFQSVINVVSYLIITILSNMR